MTTSDGITIRFLDLPPSDATVAAKELAVELKQVGLAEGDVQLSRSSDDAQDLGSILLVGAGAWLYEVLKEAGKEFVVGAARGAGQKAGREAVEWLLKKWQTRAVVTTADGRELEIGSRPSSTVGTRTKADAETLAGIKSAAIVLMGASQFPHYPAELKLDNPAFKQSAEDVKAVLTPEYTVFRNAYALDLFDTNLRPDEIVDKIEEHVTRYDDVRDVFIYYCGHGDFLTDRDRNFYLTLKSTRHGREATTGLRLRDFRLMLEQQAHLHNKRCYFIVDSCFASAAVEAFQGTSMEAVVASQFDDLLPQRGMAFLTAVDKKLPAIGRDGSGRTMFSGALVDVLRGHSGTTSGPWDLATLKEKMTSHIKALHGMAGMLPQCHAPQQSDGDVSRVPLFLFSPRTLPELNSIEAEVLAASDSVVSSDVRTSEPNSDHIDSSNCEYLDGATYSGESIDGVPHGHGTATWPDGAEYVGSFKDGQLHGHGTLTKSNGTKYVGEFKNNAFHGRGTLTQSNGLQYIGEFKGGKFNGQGAATLPGNQKYSGSWLDGVIQGYGTYTWPNGMEYVGELKDRKFSGKGVLIEPDGAKYVGEFKDGEFNGQGTYTWTSGNKYVGEFRDNKFNGQGAFYGSDGTTYEGGFHDDEFNGRGTYKHPDGTKDVGEFKDGELNGQGTRLFPDGEKYQGEFKDDKFNGQGTLTEPDGTTYEGTFKDGEKHGHFTKKTGRTATHRVFWNGKSVW